MKIYIIAYMLSCFEIPPLKQRRDDIPLLVNYFLQKNTMKDNVKSRFTPEALRMLMSAPWPGNVRQLRNVVEQCSVLCRGPLISDGLVERALRHNTGEKVTLFAQARDEFEYDYLV